MHAACTHGLCCRRSCVLSCVYTVIRSGSGSAGCSRPGRRSFSTFYFLVVRNLWHDMESRLVQRRRQTQGENCKGEVLEQRFECTT